MGSGGATVSGPDPVYPLEDPGPHPRRSGDQFAALAQHVDVEQVGDDQCFDVLEVLLAASDELRCCYVVDL
ncbi:unannotated protein [freshwater metagenome]|uniref:Unannotated protein n=1 Tax=freshwater metagenome TaxID=449393 RepID=A0A6J7UWB3_9ZZZZ